MKTVIYAAALLTAVFLGSCSKTTNTELNKIDLVFIPQASISNTAEIDAGMLAATKATNAEVKKYAQSMVIEHTKAQNDLKNWGTSIGMVIKDTLDPLHLALKSQLLNLPAGRTFDSVYIHSQVIDHDLSIANFQLEKTSGSHRDLLSYANTYLPHIIMHRESAYNISRTYFRR